MKLKLFSVLGLFLTDAQIVVFLQPVCGLVFSKSSRCSRLFVWCSRWSCLAGWVEHETTSSRVFDTKNVPSYCTARHLGRIHQTAEDLCHASTQLWYCRQFFVFFFSL